MRLQRARQIPLRLPAIHRVEGRILRQVVEHRLRRVQRAGLHFGEHALKHQVTRRHTRRWLGQCRRVGVGRAAKIPRPEPRLGHKHSELRMFRPSSKFRTRLGCVVGRRAVAQLRPRRAGQHAEGVGLERRAGKLLQQRVRIVLGLGVIPIRQRQFGPEQQQILQNRMRRRQADEPIEFLAELRPRRIAVGRPGEQLEGDALLVAVGALAQQFVERGAARTFIGAGDQAQHEPRAVQLVPFLRRHDGELPLQQCDGLALPAEGVEHGCVRPRNAVADFAALKLFEVLPLCLRLGVRHRSEPQPRLLPREDETRPGKIGPGRALRLLVEILGPVHVVRRVRQ